jgi:hypothetical protein
MKKMKETQQVEVTDLAKLIVKDMEKNTKERLRKIRIEKRKLEK